MPLAGDSRMTSYWNRVGQKLKRLLLIILSCDGSAHSSVMGIRRGQRHRCRLNTSIVISVNNRHAGNASGQIKLATRLATRQKP